MTNLNVSPMVKGDPYKWMRAFNSVLAVLIILFAILGDATDTEKVISAIGFWVLMLENGVLYVATEVWKLRHSVYND